MTDCHETFIPPLQPATIHRIPSTTATATDFLTATGFRFRPLPSERGGERAKGASDAALVALPKQFLFRSLSFAPTDRRVTGRFFSYSHILGGQT